MNGWRLAGLAAAVFLLPLFGAAAGAAGAGQKPARQVMGAVAGAGVGIIIARLAVRMAGLRKRNGGEITPCER